MAAISTMIAAAGLAIGAAGAVTSYTASRNQAAANAEQARESNANALLVQADNEKAIDAQVKAEGIRNQQMNLDAERQKRSIVRASVAAQAQANVSLTRSGASGPGSSAVGGIYANTAGQENVNLLGVDQNQQAGQAIFGAHFEQLAAYRSAAAHGYTPPAQSFAGDASMGSGLSTFGSVLGKSSDTLGKFFGSSNTFNAPSSGNNNLDIFATNQSVAGSVF